MHTFKAIKHIKWAYTYGIQHDNTLELKDIKWIYVIGKLHYNTLELKYKSEVVVQTFDLKGPGRPVSQSIIINLVTTGDGKSWLNIYCDAIK